MTNTGATPAGWYHAPGDPEDTQRYWDGGQWMGEPQQVPRSTPTPPPPPAAAATSTPPPYQASPPPYQQAPSPGSGAPPGYVAYGDADAAPTDLAEWWQRVVARIVDGLVWIVIGLVFTAIGGGGAFATGAGDGTGFFVFAIATLVGAAAVVAYEVFMTTKTGNTFGKKIFDMKIVGEDGSAVDEKQMVMRMATYIGFAVLGIIPIIGLISGFANFVVVVVSFIFLFTDAKRQTIWDKIGKTIVTAG